MEEPNSRLKPLSPGCPKCGTKLEDGWCRECSEKRQTWVLWVLFAILPVIGLGACFVPLATNFYFPGLVIVGLTGLGLCLASVLAGIIYWVILSLRKWR